MTSGKLVLNGTDSGNTQTAAGKACPAFVAFLAVACTVLADKCMDLSFLYL